MISKYDVLFVYFLFYNIELSIVIRWCRRKKDQTADLVSSQFFLWSNQCHKFPIWTMLQSISHPLGFFLSFNDKNKPQIQIFFSYNFSEYSNCITFYLVVDFSETSRRRNCLTFSEMWAFFFPYLYLPPFHLFMFSNGSLDCDSQIL